MITCSVSRRRSNARSWIRRFHTTAAIGVLGSIGYLVARPEVSGRTVKADAIRAQVGIAYAVF